MFDHLAKAGAALVKRDGLIKRNKNGACFYRTNEKPETIFLLRD